MLFAPKCFLAHLSVKLHLFQKHSSRYAPPTPTPHLPLSFNYCSNENDQSGKWQWRLRAEMSPPTQTAAEGVLMAF